MYDKLVENFPEIETIVADSAYKTPHICKKIFDDDRVLSTAYKRPMTMKGGHEWWKYVYDEYYDCIICPEYQVLKYRTTNRDGYREYKSKPEICKNCPTRHLCTNSKDCVKTITKHIWSDYIELENCTIPPVQALNLADINRKAREMHLSYGQFIELARQGKVHV